MSDALRELLYLPLGFVPALAFTLRFVVQWISSEIKKESCVQPSFWWLSLLGNSALMIHSAIQLQYPICVIQALNAVISLRNLNLMRASALQWRLKTVLGMLLAALVMPTLGFLLFSSDQWFRIPTHIFYPQSKHLSFVWQLFGALGVFLFALRFWVQWVAAERKHKSTLDAPFWWLSLVGALFSLLFFGKTRDVANLLGPLFGMVPYVRNLMLLKRGYGTV